MKVTLKTLGLGLGAAVLAVSPLAAMPQYCSNAKPGCAGTCHTDANLAKCPPKSTGQKPSSKLLEGLTGLESLTKN
jgi:hypothetical protein